MDWNSKLTNIGCDLGDGVRVGILTESDEIELSMIQWDDNGNIQKEFTKSVDFNEIDHFIEFFKMGLKCLRIAKKERDIVN